MPELNFTPTMVVALNTLHMSAVVRVTLSPVLHDAPFVGSVSFCFLDMPYLDFDLRSAAARVQTKPQAKSQVLRSVVGQRLCGP